MKWLHVGHGSDLDVSTTFLQHTVQFELGSLFAVAFAYLIVRSLFSCLSGASELKDRVSSWFELILLYGNMSLLQLKQNHSFMVIKSIDFWFKPAQLAWYLPEQRLQVIAFPLLKMISHFLHLSAEHFSQNHSRESIIENISK